MTITSKCDNEMLFVHHFQLVILPPITNLNNICTPSAHHLLANFQQNHNKIMISFNFCSAN